MPSAGRAVGTVRFCGFCGVWDAVPAPSGRSSICSTWVTWIIGPSRHSISTAHPQPLACERLGIEARNFQRVIVLAVDRNREVAMPILVEVEIDAARRFADLGHHAFDELEAGARVSPSFTS